MSPSFQNLRMAASACGKLSLGSTGLKTGMENSFATEDTEVTENGWIQDTGFRMDQARRKPCILYPVSCITSLRLCVSVVSQSSKTKRATYDGPLNVHSFRGYDVARRSRQNAQRPGEAISRAGVIGDPPSVANMAKPSFARRTRFEHIVNHHRREMSRRGDGGTRGA
jgi:hypothetical protein